MNLDKISSSHIDDKHVYSRKEYVGLKEKICICDQHCISKSICNHKQMADIVSKSVGSCIIYECQFYAMDLHRLDDNDL